MLSYRKIRIAGLSVLFVLIVLILFITNLPAAEDAEPDLSLKAQTLLTSNNLVDVSDDGKLDDAINNEISKLNDEEIPNAEVFDPAREFKQIRALSPMTIFSKTYCPYSKKVKALFNDNYQINPQPAIVELDMHEHSKELQDYLEEVTGRKTVPNILVGDSLESRGGCDDMVSLHAEGQLMALLNEWGGKLLVVKRTETPSNL
ncbi:uncharacterized protein PRCAT00006091001 [Priceomyces carsonii]|uniref:uncharacterized protein n=1 Tax=Priceomyces carsonii TaxID=28549 RepID=UPI002EDA0FFB|nr:unnamed protein product [Priceomyces carsonii]